MNTEVQGSTQNYATWGLTGTIIWGMVIITVFYITQIIVIGVYIANQYGAIDTAEFENIIAEIQYNGTVLSMATFATFIVCSSLVLGVVKLKRNSNIIHYLGVSKVDLKTLGYWLLVIVGLIVFSDLLTYLLDKPQVPEFMVSVYTNTEHTWFLWFSIIIAAPIFEELFFRGYLITGLRSSFMGPVGAVLLTSAVWAAIHIQYDLYIIATIFLTGLVLGTARIKSGSVLLTIGLHSFLNLVASIETAIFISHNSVSVT